MSAVSFDRVLGRADLLLFSVSAILTIDTLASAASMGVSWFTWWAITMVAFFVPYGLMTAELGAAWPGEGGLYVWVREALGPRWGSLAAWFYWINNAYWIPSVYLVFAGTFETIFLGTKSTWQEAAIAIALTWLTVLVGVVRLRVSKWLPNLGAVVKVAIFLGLGALGIAAVVSGRPAANDFSLGRFVPSWTDSLAFLPVLLYNTLGFELMSSAGEEMRDPQRDVPRVILLSGLAISVVYVLGALGILLAVPLADLSIVTGTWDALAVLGKPWGAAGDTLVLLLGIGFLYACVANIVTWSLGVNRVAAAAAAEGVLPAALGRLHPRFKTPYVAFAAMGAIATALLVGNALLSRSQANVFWMTFKLSGICFLISYLLVFPAFLILRDRRPDTPRPYRMPGGRPAAVAATVVCWVFVAGSCLLFFKPSSASENAAGEATLLAVETLATLVAGLLLIPRRTRPGSEAH
ncbi:MAG: APC family permease [Acidobacteria bacterium]|nr:APC family permease [Acidobacteriota bacterium]